MGARSNQVASAGVLWGYGDRAELSAAGADTIYETIPDMVQGLLPFG